MTEKQSDKTRTRGPNRPTKRGDQWSIRWYDEHGKRRRETFRLKADAEAALRKELTAVDRARKGGAPSAKPPEPTQNTEAAKEEKTLADVFAHWAEHRDKRSKADDRSMWRAHLEPAFGSLALTAITKERVDHFKTSKADLSKKTLHNLLTLLISLLNEAVAQRWLGADDLPKIDKPKIPKATHKDYKWLRTKDEIRAFLLAAQAESTEKRAGREADPTVFALYATAILTGMRAGELAGLRWDDVDLERRQIHVRHSFGGPTKSGDDRIVPIVDDALAMLKTWSLRSAGGLVFPSQRVADPKTGRRTMLTESARIFQDIFKRVLVRAGLAPGYITFHSLRHTFASHYMLDGGDIYRLRDILGHTDVKITQRYAHLSPTAYVADHARLGGLLPSTDSAAIIPIRRA